MKKLILKNKWLLMAGVVGAVAIGTSLIALVRVLRSRSEHETEDDANGHLHDSKGHDEAAEGEEPGRRRRRDRHGDRRAKAATGESSDVPASEMSLSPDSSYRH